ncbi:MAG: ABC transporter ATP-binding protein [Bacteroidales bacterium]
MSYLEVKNVSKTYINHKALDDVSLSLERGRVLGLLGPNGAGKSTLIRIINKILYADAGDILLDGEAMDFDTTRKIGYLPEERGLYQKMKVIDQLMYLARLKDLTSAEAKQGIDFWFDKFGLNDWRNKKLKELSKGMQQKVQFISTIIHKPELLIFDEPFSGFDPINVELLKSEILRMRNEGATIIFSTHNMASVEEVCDEVVLINNSKKVLDGSIAAVKEQFKEGKYTLRGKCSDSFSSFDNFVFPEGINVLEARCRDRHYSIMLTATEEIDKMSFLAFVNNGVGDLQSFEEVLPSMHEIFMKIVGERSINTTNNTDE